jgi:hypothetical protein
MDVVRDMSAPLLDDIEQQPSLADDSVMTNDDTAYADESKTLKYENRHIMLYLNTTHVIIHDMKNLKRNVDLDLGDIIGCAVTENKKKKDATTYGLRIFAYPKEASCCSGGPKRVPKTYSISFDTRLSAQNWNNAVSCAIQKIPLSFVADGTNHTVMAPPRRKFLCVVNPFSGKVCMYCYVQLCLKRVFFNIFIYLLCILIKYYREQQ